MSEWPSMFRIRQEFPSTEPVRAEDELRRQLLKSRVIDEIVPGMQVAIALGSRGIADIASLASTLVNVLTERGARPLIVPAMGSQGGATAQGQAAVLASLGITETRMNAPVRSDDAVVCTGTTPAGTPVYCDRLAAESDAVICVNRVKPHTAFRAPIESGLMKMMAIGIGKRSSAQAVHSAPGGLAEGIVQGARALMKKVPVRLGIAVVENALHRTAKVVVLEAHEIEEAEQELLKEATQMMPRLPFDDLDVLIVEEMGKNISGAGMDPNVIGMSRRLPDIGTCSPRIGRIVALSLTEASHGNAEGVGLADVISRRLMDRIDLRITYVNCITSGFLRGGMIPITCESDREAIETAMSGFSPQTVRLARIKNTGDLHELDVSEPLLGEVHRNPRLLKLGEQGQFAFSSEGHLV
jgi:hypothetical protein